MSQVRTNKLLAATIKVAPKSQKLHSEWLVGEVGGNKNLLSELMSKSN